MVFVCSIRLPHSTAAGLLLKAWRAGDTDRLLSSTQQQPCCSTAGSATLSADIGS